MHILCYVAVFECCDFDKLNFWRTRTRSFEIAPLNLDYGPLDRCRFIHRFDVEEDDSVECFFYPTVSL